MGLMEEGVREQERRGELERVIDGILVNASGK